MDLTRTYGRGDAAHTAINQVNLSVAQGELVSIVGPSGCGKSTLLDVLAGLSQPTGGEVLFEGRPLDGRVPEGVGVVFQEDASFAWLNVADNITFGLRRDGVDAAEIARRLDDALRLMGLLDFAKAYPAQLSGGMRQRVCIARTLVMQPRMILLDEPFGALDAQTRLVMGDELLKVWRATGATVLLITHALDEAAMLSDRIGVMSARPGHIIEELETGWPRERDSRIAADPAFGAITARLWSVLREESLKTMRQSKPAQGKPS
jgi:NitT/TauT family transport system ATP-binding protein